MSGARFRLDLFWNIPCGDRPMESSRNIMRNPKAEPIPFLLPVNGNFRTAEATPHAMQGAVKVVKGGRCALTA